MPERASKTKNPEAWGDFDQSKFKRYDHVTYYDQTDHLWKLGRLVDPLVVKPDEGEIAMSVVDVAGVRTDVIVKSPPPRRLEMPTITQVFKINGVDYKADILRPRLDNDGSVFLDLLPVDPTKGEVMRNVGLDMLMNVSKVEKAETSIDAKIRALDAEIKKIASIKRRDYVKRLGDLEKNLEQLVASLGNWNEWNRQDVAGAKRIGEEVARLQLQIETEVLKLEHELAAFNAAGTGLVNDSAARQVYDMLDKDVGDSFAGAKKGWEDYDAKVKAIKEEWVKYDKEHKEWELVEQDWVNFAADPNPKKKQPKKARYAEPVEPTELVVDVEADKPQIEDAGGNTVDMPKTKEGMAAIRFGELKAFVAANPAYNGRDRHKSIVTEVERRLAEAKLQLARKLKQPELDTLTGSIYIKVIEELKATEIVAGDKFDFEVARTELKNKLEELKGKNISDKLKSEIDILLLKVNVLLANKKDVEKELADFWQEEGKLEVAAFKEEMGPAKKVEEKEGDVDLSNEVLEKLLDTRPVQVHAFLEKLYRNKLVTTEEGELKDGELLDSLKAIFKDHGSKDDEATLQLLARYGIRDWKQFSKIWEGKAGRTALIMMKQWVDADIRNMAVDQTSAWGNIKAMKWQLGARILTTIACVGGGVLATSLVLGTGGLGGIGLAAGAVGAGSLFSSTGIAAAGGLVGGGLRGLLQKFVFGGKFFEDRKKKKLEAVFEAKRQDVIDQMLAKRFTKNVGGAITGFASFAKEELAAFMTEALREATVDKTKVAEKDKVAGIDLQGESARLYAQALKNMRLEGVEPSVEQKRQFALALTVLVEKGKQKANEVAKSSDPLAVRILDGVMQGYSGQLASRENFSAVKGFGSSMLLGAGMGVAFAAAPATARALMGFAGGFTAGYHYEDQKEKKDSAEDVRLALELRFKNAAAGMRDFRDGTITPRDLQILCRDLPYLNKLIKIIESKDEAQFKALPAETQALVVQLSKNNQLRLNFVSLINEAYSRGLFAHLALSDLQKHSDEVVVDVKKGSRPWWDKVYGDKKIGRKLAKATIWGLGGAAAAAALGYGFKQLIEYGKEELMEHFGLFAPEKAAVITYPAGKYVPTAEAAAGAAAVTGAEHIHAGGTGAHDVVPTGAKSGVGAELHEVTVNHSPDYVAKSVYVDPVEKNGSAWDSLDDLHKAAASKGTFAGWTDKQFADWRHDELARLGYKFLPNGDIAHPVNLLAPTDVKVGGEIIGTKSAGMELYTGGDGKPHVRLVELFTDKSGAQEITNVGSGKGGHVKILDHYIVQETSTDKPEVTVPESKGASSFIDELNKGKGVRVANDLSFDGKSRIFTGAHDVDITKASLKGHSGLVEAFHKGHSVVARPVFEDGKWHLQSLDDRGVWQKSDADIDTITKGAHKYYVVEGSFDGTHNSSHQGHDLPLVYNEDGKLFGHVGAGGKLVAFPAGYSDYPVGAPDHIDINEGGVETHFAPIGDTVDKAHLADVFSGKGQPETTMVKGDAGVAEGAGGKSAVGGGEVPEAKPAVWDAHLTKAEVAEYQGVIKDTAGMFKSDMANVFDNPNNVYSDETGAGLKDFVARDIDRVINEAVKGVTKGQLPFELGQALEPNQSMNLADKLALVRGSVHDVLMNDLSPESQLFLGGPNTDYSMPVSAWGATEGVFVAPEGSHLVAIELPDNKWEFVYDNDLKFSAAGPGQPLTVEQPNGNSFAATLKPDAGGTFTIIPANR